MTKINNTTKRQHYIPQLFIRRFYPETEDVQIPERYPYLWQYDKKNGVERKIFSIKTICCENYLYELRNSNGEIVEKYKNYVEINLGRNEQVWAMFIRTLDVNQVGAREFSYGERKLLYSMVTTQIMRTPEMLFYIGHYYLLHMNNILLYELNLQSILERQNLCIGYTKEHFILNSSRPVLILDVLHDKYIIFPFDKHFCIILFPKQKHTKYNNKIIDIKDNYIKKINQHIFDNFGRLYYSTRRISTIIDTYQ